jgi:hypothetical protein
MFIQLAAEPPSGIATRQSLQAELHPKAQPIFTFFYICKNSHNA